MGLIQGFLGLFLLATVIGIDAQISRDVQTLQPELQNILVGIGSRTLIGLLSIIKDSKPSYSTQYGYTDSTGDSRPQGPQR